MIVTYLILGAIVIAGVSALVIRYGPTIFGSLIVVGVLGGIGMIVGLILRVLGMIQGDWGIVAFNWAINGLWAGIVVSVFMGSESLSLEEIITGLTWAAVIGGVAALALLFIIGPEGILWGLGIGIGIAILVVAVYLWNKLRSVLMTTLAFLAIGGVCALVLNIIGIVPDMTLQLGWVYAKTIGAVSFIFLTTGNLVQLEDEEILTEKYAERIHGMSTHEIRKEFGDLKGTSYEERQVIKKVQQEQQLTEEEILLLIIVALRDAGIIID